MGAHKLLYHYPFLQGYKEINTMSAGLPNRHEAGNEYRYGFQGQEKDDEIKGEGNSIKYKYRMHYPRVERFFAVDPLIAKYPHNGPYNFSENRVNDAIELEGLEAFFIHGTTNFDVLGVNVSPGTHYFNGDQKIVKELPKAFGNTISNSSFRWSGDDTDAARKAGGRALVEHILANRKDGEPITLVGHSHGGNVAIEAALILVNEYGVDPNEINIVALNTPDQQQQQVPEGSDINLYVISAYGDIVQEMGSDLGAFDSNGIDVDNGDVYIHFEDQNKGGPCDFSNHCPSDENFDEWFPVLKPQIVKNMSVIMREQGEREVEQNKQNQGTGGWY